jgi:molybdopterin synthase catalytic subunit
MIKIQQEDFDINKLINRIRSCDSGCIVSFIGTVREHSRGKEVTRMSLEVYEELALSELKRITEEASEKYSLNEVYIIHRFGDLLVGDNIVYIGVSAGHREQGFGGCRYIIDELKKRVPIWKKEYTEDGEEWVEGEKIE